jgi:NADPH-dependent curcumin reductase CurA
MAVNLQVQLARQPEGVPKPGDFQIGQGPRPAAGPGQILVRNIYLSLDPYQRGAIAGTFGPARLNQGDVIMGRCLGEVVESHHPNHKPGDIVVVESGWQQYFAVDGGAAGLVRKIKPEAPLSLYLGALGPPGLTAWGGVERLAPPGLGETFVVSAASGPVGSVAGQLAKAKGARVVGIAGSEEKCRLATQKFGFDACVNYKTADWTAALKAACPGGVNVYFDNVGGAMLDALLAELAAFGRVVLCGFISQYNVTGARATNNLGPLIAKRATMKGLVVYDFLGETDQFIKAATALWKQGKLATHEDRVAGIENAPAHFVKLMKGENVGKAIVALAPEKA